MTDNVSQSKYILNKKVLKKKYAMLNFNRELHPTNAVKRSRANNHSCVSVKDGTTIISRIYLHSFVITLFKQS